MRTAVHGMPRIGKNRVLKWALEAFWAGHTGAEELEMCAAAIRRENWKTVTQAAVDFVPSNDFSLYDHVLDAAVAVGAVPERFRPDDEPVDLARYFAMARGGDLGSGPVTPLSLTKWFDTNYHHLVPEIEPDIAFRADATKACAEMAESATLGISTTPALVGPLTLLLRSAPAGAGFDVTTTLERLVDTYAELLSELARYGATWVRLDEPALVEDRSAEELEALRRVYERLADVDGRPAMALSTYFGHVGEAMAVLRDLPVDGVGLDFCRGPANLPLLLEAGGLGDRVLFAGVVDGRNVWVNDLEASLSLLERLTGLCAEVVVSTSCSLIHVPMSLAPETALDAEVQPWLAFAEEKTRRAGRPRPRLQQEPRGRVERHRGKPGSSSGQAALHAGCRSCSPPSPRGDCARSPPDRHARRALRGPTVAPGSADASHHHHRIVPPDLRAARRTCLVASRPEHRRGVPELVAVGDQPRSGFAGRAGTGRTCPR